jgi:D-alanyl-D-alanine carboxypeptidase
MFEWVRGGWRSGTFSPGAGRVVFIALLGIFLASAWIGESVAKPRFSAIAVDARTGKILFSRDPDGLTHPASLTKVMTLYILFDEIKAGRIALDSQLKVSKAAASKAPSKLGLKPGQTISVENAIKALVTRSANDVAATIGENLNGNETAFAARMTKTAHDLGMSRTTFRNASGLPHPGQVTTARDMATLSLRIQRDFPQYYPYFNIRSFTYGRQVIRTHNRLLGRYAGADGIKTGYIRASGFNLTSSAKRGNKRVIGVVMGASSGSSRNLYMMAMLDKAFPKCKDGSNLVSAIEGVSPKRAAPEVKVAETAPAAEKKAASKPTKVEQAEAEPELVAADDENVAEEESGDEASGEGKALETAMAEAAEAPEMPTEPADSSPQTVLSKTSPDGSALPFAVKSPGGDPGGIIILSDADLTWHIQIGAYPSKKDAQAILYKIRDLGLDLLEKKQALTIEVQKGNETLYRARFSGFTEKAARAVCLRLSKQGFGCVAMQPQS